MSGDININFGEAILPVVDKIASIFGQDEYSRSIRSRLVRRARLSQEESRNVLIASMDDEVPLSEIYQPLRVRVGGANSKRIISVEELTKELDHSAILLAGPGGGKSITLRYICSALENSKTKLPLLLSLKDTTARRDLDDIHAALRIRGTALIGRLKLLLLLDGFDEISYQDRVSLSATLRELNSMADVRFLLTCRPYYDIPDLPVRRCYLMPFTDADAVAFLTVFLKKKESEVSAEQLLELMIKRGFSQYFVHNPLLLALTAILQTGQTPQVPRDAVKLLTYVVGFLSFQWDRNKGVNRECLEGFDGEDLLKCLMRVAARSETIEIGQPIAEAAIREHIDLMQINPIEPVRVLKEIAGWFGFIVETEIREWSFVHASIQDFLAAKFMVESGTFNPNAARKNWRRPTTQRALCPTRLSIFVRRSETRSSKCSLNAARTTPRLTQ